VTIRKFNAIDVQVMQVFISIKSKPHEKSFGDAIGRKFRGKFLLDHSFPRTRSAPCDDLGNMTRLRALGPLEHRQA